MESKPIVVFCTTPDFECAQNIATTLVEEKFAACCNIIQGLVSIYRWENKIQREDELLLIIKSSSEKFSSIEERVKNLHPFETPEIIGTDFSYSSNKYLSWIIESVR